MPFNWKKDVFYGKVYIYLRINTKILPLSTMVNSQEQIRKKGKNVTTDHTPGAVVTVLGVGSDRFKNTPKRSKITFIANNILHKAT